MWWGATLLTSARPPKGKGKGKEDKVFSAKGIKGKGMGANGKGLDKGTVKGTPVCGQGSADMMLRGVGRFTPTSFFGNPPMLSKNYYPSDRSGNNGVSVCCLECDGGARQTVVRSRPKANKNFMQTPPGLKDDTGLDNCSETVDVGSSR